MLDADVKNGRPHCAPRSNTVGVPLFYGQSSLSLKVVVAEFY